MLFNRIFRRLADLLDVSIAAPSAGQVLKYNATEWANGEAGSSTITLNTTSPITGGGTGDSFTLGAAPATALAAGIQSAAHYALLNDATPGSTSAPALAAANKLVKRDGSGRISNVEVAGFLDIVNPATNTAMVLINTGDHNAYFACDLIADTLTGVGEAITGLDAGNISAGTLANARTSATSANTASAIVARNGSGGFSAGAITATSFTGNGSGLTNLSAGSLPATVPFKNTANTFALPQTIAVSVATEVPLVLTGATGSTANVQAWNGHGGFAYMDAACNLTVSGNITSQSALAGTGSAITALNGSNISTGTVAAARLPSTVVHTNVANTFGAAQTFGTLTATTLAGNGASLTALNGSNISTGTVANARTTATSANTASAIVARDGSGNFTANDISVSTLNVTGGLVSLNAGWIDNAALSNTGDMSFVNGAIMDMGGSVSSIYMQGASLYMGGGNIDCGGGSITNMVNIDGGSNDVNIATDGSIAIHSALSGHVQFEGTPVFMGYGVGGSGGTLDMEFGSIVNATSVTTGTLTVGGAEIRAPYYARVTSDLSTTSTTAVNATGLSFAVVNGETWEFEIQMRLGSSSLSGMKFAVAVPTSSSFQAGVYGTSTATAMRAEALNTSGTLTTNGIATATMTNGSGTIRGLVVAGSSGTVQIQYAAVGGTVTIYQNSYIVARRFA